jgi:hypothetical protein
MAKRQNHYEAAFENYLRAAAAPYVAVDEARRALASGGSLKSLDFIVSPPEASPNWLVDVKGRRFPSGDIQKQYWKNWTTRDDLVSLARWETLFGDGFAGLFVFAYLVLGERAPLPTEMLHAFRDRLYAFVAVRLTDYAAWARPISTAWDTLAMPARRFRAHARPLDVFLSTADVAS